MTRKAKFSKALYKEGLALLQWKRRRAGSYEYGQWTVGETEGEQREPGYHWAAHHFDKGEFYFATLRDAKKFVIRRSDEYDAEIREIREFNRH